MAAARSDQAASSTPSPSLESPVIAGLSYLQCKEESKEQSLFLHLPSSWSLLTRLCLFWKRQDYYKKGTNEFDSGVWGSRHARRCRRARSQQDARVARRRCRQHGSASAPSVRQECNPHVATSAGCASWGCPSQRREGSAMGRVAEGPETSTYARLCG